MKDTVKAGISSTRSVSSTRSGPDTKFDECHKISEVSDARIGHRVRKHFEEEGGFHMGTVVGPTPYYRGKMFRVRYDDDSMEDLTSNDLDAIMLRRSKRDSHGPDKDLEVSEAVDMTGGDIDRSADPHF